MAGNEFVVIANDLVIFASKDVLDDSLEMTFLRHLCLITILRHFLAVFAFRIAIFMYDTIR